ncbi:hypothetical protein KKG45_12825, partial [bacterium]|nr:hypothetical protein [bacterium]
MFEKRPDREVPHHSIAWRLILAAAASAVVVWPLRAFMPWLPALMLGASWTASVLFLLLDTAVRRLWIAYLVLTVPVLLLFGAESGGRQIAVSLNFCFLLLRRQRPWRLLSSAQRAAAFFLGVAALVLVSWDWHWPDTDGMGWFMGFINNFGRTCQGSLRLFWVFSLLRLLFGIRLHFLRLKPKLAVMAVLIAAIPLLLLSTFGLVALYGAMGGVTTARGRDVLQDWAANPAAIRGCAAVTDAAGFDWAAGRSNDRLPDWLVGFRAALDRPVPASDEQVPAATGMKLTIAGEEQVVKSGAWAPADTAAVFRIADELWLLDIRGLGTGDAHITGVPLDAGVLDRLSGLLRADVGVLATRGELAIATADAEADSLDGRISLQGSYRDSTAASIWSRPLYFGGAQVPLIVLAGGHFAYGDFLLHVQVSLADLADEFVTGENTFNKAV